MPELWVCRFPAAADLRECFSETQEKMVLPGPDSLFLRRISICVMIDSV